MLDLLDPRPGERILDLGCGDGALTAKLAAIGVDVLGVDASAEQVAAARAAGLNAQRADGEALNFAAEFDAVFSNAALHWMRRPQAVIAGVWRALKPGGRFVAEMGGAGNVAAIADALEMALARRGLDGKAANPWFFPTPSDYRAALERQGFVLRQIELIPRPTPLPGEMTAWLETFAENFTKPIPPADRPAFLAEVAQSLAPSLRDAMGRWTADYVRLRFAAVKPDSAGA